MRFYFKGMEVVKRRHKSFENCQDDIAYDKWLVLNISTELQCTPPYWRMDDKHPTCRNQTELERAQKMFWGYFYGSVEANHPCTEIQKVDMEYEETDDDTLGPGEMRIQVMYLSSTYKEIRQMKAYTIMMLFGNVGGFVGLLLGYALIQIPSLIHSIFSCFKNKNPKN